MSKDFFSKEEFQDRWKKVRNSMKKFEIELLMVISPTNINYLIGTPAKGYQEFEVLLFSINSDPSVMFTRRSELEMMKDYSLADEVFGWGGQESEDPIDALKKLMLEKKLLNKRIGIEIPHYYLHPLEYKKIIDMLGDSIVHDSTNLIGDIKRVVEGECEDVTNYWMERYAQTFIDYEVREDGADSVYIIPSAQFVARWPIDEWKRLPSNAEEVVWNSVDEINEGNGYGDIFVPSNHDTPTIRRVRDEIHLSIQVNFEHPKIYGGSYMALTEEYNEACQAIDTIIDDHRDAWEEILTTYFKREGQMEGGEYANLAVAIEDGILTSYEWDLESDGEYYESYESTARYSHYYDPEDLGLSMEVLMQILDSRDFKIELRKQLLEAPRKEQNTQYYLQMNATTVEHAGEAKYTAIFSINADEPDIMAGLFQELVEGEMDDEDNLNVVFNRVLAQFVNARQPSHMQTNESIVKSWKGFLSG